jgi:hypothetical protein
MKVRLPLLLLAVTSQTGDSTADGSLNALADPLAQVAQLALGFLALALSVLLASLSLEALVSDKVSCCLLHAAQRLVVFPLRPVGAVLGDTALCAEGIRAGLEGGFGGGVLGVCLGLCGFGVGLVGWNVRTCSRRVLGRLVTLSALGN